MISKRAFICSTLERERFMMLHLKYSNISRPKYSEHVDMSLSLINDLGYLVWNVRFLNNFARNLLLSGHLF